MKVEMAALVAGVQYGLSQGHFNENKSLIFVKLTDSAFRAIEEYSRNRNKCNENPTIQFLDNGNEGRLSFPSISQPAQRGGRVGFNFSLSNNADIEGPQGSFECIKQNGPKCLETVGSLQCKMRIHANEDIYEATRSRMAAVEQQQKKNCTREIELNKTGIGRKAKICRNSAPKIDPIPPSSYGYPSIKYQTSSSNKSSCSPALKHGNPDIVRQPLRTRLIHLLAVRNYKKPEIYAAISRDGMKERDKNQLMPTLLSIASVRDNTYRLFRHIWNEVREDWPFYTEQERQMLKRNKPQNLTPPGNSDGGSSASSGQSPGSNHPGSPPSAIEGPSSLKRPGYFNGVDGIQTKRHRVSHYRKPAGNGTSISSIPSQNDESRFSAKSKMDSLANDNGFSSKRTRMDNMDLFNNMNDRSPLSLNTMTSYKAETDSDNDDFFCPKSLNRSSSPQLSPVVNKNYSPSTAHNAHISSTPSDARLSSTDVTQRKSSKLPKLCLDNEEVRADVSSWLNNSSDDVDMALPEQQYTTSSTKPYDVTSSTDIMSKSDSQFPSLSESVPVDTSHVKKENLDKSHMKKQTPDTRQIKKENIDTRHVKKENVSASHLKKENLDMNTCNQNSSALVQDSFQPLECTVQQAQPLPRYMKDYTTIKTLEQRRKYKDDFNANYTEYKSLHKIVEHTTAKFSYLEEELKKHPKNSAEYEKIKKEIVMRYKAVKNNKNYQATKQKFQYLHDKLSHIKKLVSDFDNLHLKNSNACKMEPVS
nr:PREDICTED: RNA polymerase II elongation factor Ell [Bemisia tabaci]